MDSQTWIGAPAGWTWQAVVMTSRQNEVVYLGLDTGLNGGLAFMNRWGELLATAIMPTQPRADQVRKKKKLSKTGKRQASRVEVDTLRLVRMVEEFKRLARCSDLRVAVEHVWSRPTDSRPTAFSFGMAYAGALAAVQMLEIEPSFVTPVSWKNQVLGKAFDHTKQGAIAYARRRYRSHCLMPSKRSLVGHDGIADAICIARWLHDSLSTEDEQGDFMAL